MRNKVTWKGKGVGYGRKVMRLIFYLLEFLFLSNIDVIPFKIVALDGEVPTFGSRAESLKPVWLSVCPLHSFGCILKS